MLTPRERVEAVLLGKKADYIPFTVYAGMLPACELERNLRNKGLCPVRGAGYTFCDNPNYKEVITHYSENGKSMVRIDIETPKGPLKIIQEILPMDAPQGSTVVEVEKIFKDKEDYKKVISIVEGRTYRANPDGVRKREKLWGGDIIPTNRIGYDPLHEIIIHIMGVETFSMEWADNQDEVLKLYQALVEDRRRAYPAIADTPVLCTNYGGNIVAEIVGADRFEKYVLPNFQEAAEVFHKKGRLIGSHMDANNKMIASLLNKSGLDYIEAFTPSPDTDMNMREAFDAWPEKIMWINFPSSVHLCDEKAIKKATLEIIEQSGKNKHKLIVGITEDVPNGKWEKSFPVIMDTLMEYGKL